MTAIRLALAEDAPSIAALANEVHAVPAVARPDVFKPVSDEVFTPAAMANLVRTDGHALWVAEDGGRGVGFAHAELRHAPEMPWGYAATIVALHSMGVTAALRSSGIGTKLLNAVWQFAREHGAREVQVTVW